MEHSKKDDVACLIYTDGVNNIKIFHNTPYYPISIWGILYQFTRCDILYFMPYTVTCLPDPPIQILILVSLLQHAQHLIVFRSINIAVLLVLLQVLNTAIGYMQGGKCDIFPSFMQNIIYLNCDKEEMVYPFHSCLVVAVNCIMDDIFVYYEFQ